MKEPRKILIGFQEGTCQLHCKKCIGFSNNQERKVKFNKMPMDKAKQLIDEIALMSNVPIVAPHIYTEPFTNPDLKEIIRYSVSKGIHLSIITNGILMNDDIGAFLLQTLDRHSTVSFSLDAVSQEVYEKVRGDYLLEEIENKIIKLIKCRKENKGPRITVSITIEDENKHELDSFLAKWKYLADGVRADVAYTLDRKIPKQFKRDDDHAHLKGCANLQDMVISADGNVRICCEDVFGDTDFGNVFEKGIMGVWNSEELENYRKKINSDKLESKDFCYGCEAGNMTGMKVRETEDFVIKEAMYWTFYNQKKEWIRGTDKESR